MFERNTAVVVIDPTKPNHFFDYEVHPNENEAGSYFYHSHVQFQTVSASGPLVVQEPDGKPPPYQYDDERIVFLSELYNRTDESIFNGLIGAPFVWYVLQADSSLERWLS